MIRKIVRISLAFFLIVACFFTNIAPSSAAAYTFQAPGWSITSFVPGAMDGGTGWWASGGYRFIGSPSDYGASINISATMGTGPTCTGGYTTGQLSGTYLNNVDDPHQNGWATHQWDATPPCRIQIYINGVLRLDYNVNAASVPDPAPVVTAGACSLSDSQLVMLARSAGWTTDAQLQTATAIAIAESKGVVNALHYNGPAPGSWDIGLWQINDDAHTSYTPVTLGTNPLYNASAAHDIYVAASNAFTPWATFTSGAYLKYMTRASQALQVAGTGVYPTINCSGALGNPDDPLYNQDPTDATTGTCTGWNPLTYIKCALKWAFVPDDSAFNSWQGQIDSMKAKPPISWCIGGVYFIQAIFAEFNGDTPSSAAGWNTDFHAPGPHGTSIVWNPFQSASVLAATDGNFAYVRTAVEMGMWLSLFLWVWKRARMSFGGKSAT